MPKNSSPSKLHPEPHRRAFHQRSRKLQAAVEFALAFPILLLVIFGIMEFSLLFAGWLAVENVARQAAYYAATGQYNVIHCPSGSFQGPDGVTYTGTGTCSSTDGATKSAEVDTARTLSIKDYVNTNFHILIFETTGAAQNAAGFYDITICTNTDTDNPPDNVSDFALKYPVIGGTNPGDYAACTIAGTVPGTPTEYAGAPYYDSIIMVDYNYPYITPLIGNFAANYFH